MLRMTDDGAAGRRQGGRSGTASRRRRDCAVGGAPVLGALLPLLPLLPAWRLAAQSGSLQKRVDARLDAPPFNRQLWGVALVDEKGTLLFGRNADRMFVPASNTKIVVSAVSSALFAPDFTVKTSIYGSGPVVNGVLQGDLVLYGRGDPTFSVRCYAIDTTAAGACDTSASGRLQELAAQLARAGVTSRCR